MGVYVNRVSESGVDVVFGIVQEFEDVVSDKIGTAVIVSWGPVWVGDYE